MPSAGAWGGRHPREDRRRHTARAQGGGTARAFLPRLPPGAAEDPALCRLSSAPPAFRQQGTSALRVLPAREGRAPQPTSPPGAAFPTLLRAPPSQIEGSLLPAPAPIRVQVVPTYPNANGLQLLGGRAGQSRLRPCVPVSQKNGVETDPGAALTRPWTCLCPSCAS